jgi:hypothetical protein
MGCHDDNQHGSAGCACQRGGGDTDSVHQLLNHPAVLNHGQGINSVLLGDFIMGLARLSASRVVNEGDAEYNQGDRQSFEDKTSDELRQEILEELADVVSYTAFLAMKVGAKV